MKTAETKTVDVAKALESSYKFWLWCNAPGGMPEHYPDEEVVRFLMRHKGKKLKVLDLGSGSGKNTVAVAELGFETHYVDYAQPGLEYTAERLKRYGRTGIGHRVDFSAEKLPYADASFDLIVAIQVFDHLLIKDARALRAEVLRVLKPGGQMLATHMTTRTDRKSRTGHPLAGEPDTQLVSSGNSSGEIHRFFTAAQAEEFFVSAEFKVKGAATWTHRDDVSGETAEARYFVMEKSAA